VWVALDQPCWPLPEVPELDGATGWLPVEAGPYPWNADASRQLENFTDFGHFPWVHPGLLGDPSRPVVPKHTVAVEGHVLNYSIVRPEAPNSDDFPVFANEVQNAPERRSRYQLHLPYTILLLKTSARRAGELRLGMLADAGEVSARSAATARPAYGLLPDPPRLQCRRSTSTAQHRCSRGVERIACTRSQKQRLGGGSVCRRAGDQSPHWGGSAVTCRSWYASAPHGPFSTPMPLWRTPPNGW
jgi:Vanillate O-demethylase oxygenase C-terminal domain